MLPVHFRFYGILNDFLPIYRKQTAFFHFLKERDSVKDAIEGLGVPHPEVDLILANGEAVDFSYLVNQGDWLSIYPCFFSFDLTSIISLRPPLTVTRFVLDVHLGKLASYLRMLGFDTLYCNNYADAELALISSEENRILLTCDRGLLKRSIVTYGYCIRQHNPEKQLIEVLKRFDLFQKISPWQRCLNCNHLIQPIDKNLIRDRLPEKVQQYYDEFHYCQGCDRLYWKGSHYEKMQKFIDKMRTTFLCTSVSLCAIKL